MNPIKAVLLCFSVYLTSCTGINLSQSKIPISPLYEKSFNKLEGNYVISSGETKGRPKTWITYQLNPIDEKTIELTEYKDGVLSMGEVL